MGVRFRNIVIVSAGAVCLAVAGTLWLLHAATYCGTSPLDDLPWSARLPAVAVVALAVAILALAGSAAGSAAGKPGGSRWVGALFACGLVYFVGLCVVRVSLLDTYRQNGVSGEPTAQPDGTYTLVNFHNGIIATIDGDDYRWLRRLRFLVMSSFCGVFFGAVGFVLVGSGLSPRRVSAEQPYAPSDFRRT